MMTLVTLYHHCGESLLVIDTTVCHLVRMPPHNGFQIGFCTYRVLLRGRSITYGAIASNHSPMKTKLKYEKQSIYIWNPQTKFPNNAKSRRLKASNRMCVYLVVPFEYANWFGVIRYGIWFGELIWLRVKWCYYSGSANTSSLLFVFGALFGQCVNTVNAVLILLTV